MSPFERIVAYITLFLIGFALGISHERNRKPWELRFDNIRIEQFRTQRECLDYRKNWLKDRKKQYEVFGCDYKT